MPPTVTASEKAIDVSVVMPCLNEARTLAACIREAKTALVQAGLRGEVVIADNGSTDGSQAIALAEGGATRPCQPARLRVCSAGRHRRRATTRGGDGRRGRQLRFRRHRSLCGETAPGL